MTQDKAKPKTLSDWLEENNAKLMWGKVVPEIGDLFCYLVNGSLVLMMEYDKSGPPAWDVFLPVTDPEVTGTLAIMSAACGLTEPVEEMTLTGATMFARDTDA